MVRLIVFYKVSLADGHGNFGSLMTSTAMRFVNTKISLEMLSDINKDTVDFVPTDESLKEPVCLHVSKHVCELAWYRQATNIPPHNLSELQMGLS